MGRSSERWVAMLVEAAPIWLGVPAWATVAGRDLTFFFVPGLFMLAAGLVVSGAALVAFAGFVRERAKASLKFQGWVLTAVPVWGLGCGLAALFDAPNPTMDHPPVLLEFALSVGAFAFGLILPFVELIRAGIGIVAARRGPAPPGTNEAASGIM